MKTAFVLFVSVLLLFSLGLIMVFNTTSAEVIDKVDGIHSHFSALKQGGFAILGMGCAALIYYFDYKRLLRYSPYLFLLLNLFLVLVFVPKVGMHINGAHRWINVFGISLQPSEFAKLLLPIYYIHVFFQKRGAFTCKEFYLWQIPFMIPIFLIINEPDNGTAAILLATMVTLYFLTKIRWIYWMVPILIVLGAGVFLATSMQHVSDRIYIYLHPEEDLLGKGHQPYQAKIATGSGGVMGKGLGNSLQKLNYLPEARSDYIAAIYAEEMGFMGILFLVTLYMTIASLGFRIAAQAKDPEGFFLATIFTFIISLQAFLNLGIVSGILPSKGTNLPFFSQGGSSLLANMMMVAVLINIHIKGKQRCLEKASQ